jgi:tetratricopeptide (TPR) repeat protein
MPGLLKKILSVGRALTLLALYNLPANIYGQTNLVDSMINWIATHPKIDSQYIQTLHRISYRLSETDVKKSFEYYEKVSALSDSLNFTYGKAIAQINLGILLANSGNFEASNNAYFKAIDEAEPCGALRAKAVSLNNIGDNYKTLRDFLRCRKYSKEAITINMQLKAWRGVAINYELLYQCDFEEGLYNNARNDLDKGMPFATKANENYIYSQYYLDFGKLHSVNNHADSSILYFSRALEQARLQGDRRNEAQTYLAEAKYLKKLGKKSKIALLDSALNIAKETKYLDGIANASGQLSQVYNEAKDKDSSFFFYTIYRAASDSLFSEKNRRNVIIKESEWMIRGKEIENQNLKELANLQSRQINITTRLLRTVLFAIIVSLVLTIFIAYFIYKSVQSNKKHKESEFKQKIAEMETQVLRAQMNPHFIFNSLNSINRFILQNNRQEASGYLSKFSKLMRMILYNSKAPLIPLDNELEALTLYLELEALRFNFHFSYKISVSDDVDASLVKVPPLIIQPYAENSIWHGLMHKEEKGELKIEVSNENDSLAIKISDDGIGRKQAAAMASKSAIKHKSMGLKITAERIAMLKSPNPLESPVTINDLVYADGTAAGTEVIIKIPIIYD